MSDIAERLRAACNGHPAAKVPWPHRVLHEGADEIDRLRSAARAVIQAHTDLHGYDGGRNEQPERRTALTMELATALERLDELLPDETAPTWAELDPIGAALDAAGPQVTRDHKL